MVMKNISRDYDITIDTLQAEVERRLNQKKRKEKRNEFNQKKRSLTGSIGSFSVKRKDGPRETHEHMLLTLLSRENHLYSVVSERYPVSSYSEGSNREMAEVLYQKLSDGNDFLLEEYITKLEPAKAAMIVGFSKDCNFEEPEKAIEDILKKLETIKLREEMKDIQAQLKNINDVNEEQRLKRQLQEIIQRMCR
jgi:hypothetical protein